MLLALVGFMGSGKTTTAQQLKGYYKDYNVFSIDDEIEKNSKQKIRDIFKTYGESYFRELENKTIKNITNNNENCILDLGGGAFIQENNRLLFKEKNVKTIFLNVEFDEICRRLENEYEARPMLGDKNWKENARNLFNYRYDIYKQADIGIKIKEGDTPMLVCEMVIDAINKKIL